MQLELLATEEYPLHCSGLPGLVQCNWRTIMTIFGDGGRESGIAADTGSALHMAARAFHTVCEKDTRLSLGVMRQSISDYPLADLDDAEAMFLRYAEDPRNQEAVVILCEQKIQLKLPPTEDDPTQKEIHIIGTLDQVREVDNGQLTMWDIKTGKKLAGFEMLDEHALQMAAYQVAASQLLGRDVQSAGVIRTRDYMSRTRGIVFWQAAWNLAGARLMLEAVRHTVANIRRGIAFPAPGPLCKYCVGTANCFPAYQEIGLEKVKQAKAGIQRQ